MIIYTNNSDNIQCSRKEKTNKIKKKGFLSLSPFEIFSELTSFKMLLVPQYLSDRLQILTQSFQLKASQIWGPVCLTFSQKLLANFLL